jgi:phosphoadenosine phosphosulfate reductase
VIESHIIVMVKRSLSDAEETLLSQYPRDFANVPKLTDYGKNESDIAFNKADETARMDQLEAQLTATLKQAVESKERPMFTIALIAGDVVILDALHKADLLNKVKIVYVDTFTLFPETNAFLHEVEETYGFKADVFHAEGIKDQAEFEAKQQSGDLPNWDYTVAKDVEEYDQLCKVEPLTRAIKANNSDCWMNGRRRDHGAERAALAVWEGAKLNPLAYWTFEDCWLYLRRHNVKYHPLHDVGYSSIGDVQSTLKVPLAEWMAYAGERKGRFQNMKNADGSSKTECGIHNNPNKKRRTTVGSPPVEEGQKA